MGQKQNGQAIHVLMIEDDADNALLTSAALKEMGSRRFEVLPAKVIEFVSLLVGWKCDAGKPVAGSSPVPAAV